MHVDPLSDCISYNSSRNSWGYFKGGLAVLPATEAEEFYELIDYRALVRGRVEFWLNNGKLSDVACAFHLDRLERSPEWCPRYEMQATRVFHLCQRVGLSPLFPFDGSIVATSLPFLAAHPIEISQLINPFLTLGKYYQPLAALPRATEIYERLVNVPFHPDVARLDTEDLVNTLKRIATG